MPAALMLLLGLGVSTLASYVALDLARRVRVLRTRAGALWLFGAASALAIGIWSSQIIGIAAEPPAVRLRLRRLRLARRLGGGAGRGLAGLGAVSGRVATPRPGRLRRVRARHRRRRHARPRARRRSACSPGIDWQLLPLVAAFVGRRRRLHDGARRVLPRRRPHQAGDARPGRRPSALVLGVTLVASQQLVLGAAGLGRADRLAARRAASPRRRWPCSPRSARARCSWSACSSRSSRRACAGRCAAPRPSCSGARFRDGLTGLPNRLMFEGMLAQAVQQADATRQRLAILFIDLDGFKPVNESLGHAHRRPRAARDRGAPEALRPARGPGRPPRRRRVPDADRRQPERRGRGDLRRAAAGLDRRAVPDERPRGDGLELDRHRAVSRARADARR